MSSALAMLAAVLLDSVLGEPRHAHPLVAFGRLAGWIEAHLHRDQRMAGVGAWCLAVLPPVLLLKTALTVVSTSWMAATIDVLVLGFALGLRSLGEHAQPVARALARGDLVCARAAVACLVSRDTAALDPTQVATAATESVLENGNDAVLGALFWFAVLGAPGALLYRLANTLDAMWGYRTPRYRHFGWAAARFDDALNFLPARLCALTYALCGQCRLALRCWRSQAAQWDSPNAGPVMAAGAGALGIRLGGAAPYHGEWRQRPMLGAGMPADAASITRALWLLRKGVLLWLLVAVMIASLAGVSAHA